MIFELGDLFCDFSTTPNLHLEARIIKYPNRESIYQRSCKRLERLTNPHRMHSKVNPLTGYPICGPFDKPIVVVIELQWQNLQSISDENYENATVLVLSSKELHS